MWPARSTPSTTHGDSRGFSTGNASPALRHNCFDANQLYRSERYCWALSRVLVRHTKRHVSRLLTPGLTTMSERVRRWRTVISRRSLLLDLGRDLPGQKGLGAAIPALDGHRPAVIARPKLVH